MYIGDPLTILTLIMEISIELIYTLQHLTPHDTGRSQKFKDSVTC